MKKGKTSKIFALVLAVLLMCVTVFAMSGCEKDKAKSEDTSKDGITKAEKVTGKDVTKAENKTTIWYITLSTAGVTNKMADLAFKYVTKYYPNISVVMQDAQYKPDNQVTFLEEALTQKIDAVMIEAMDPAATQGPIEALEAAGIPVITINLNTLAIHSLHIQGNDYNSGVEAADTLAKASGEKGVAVALDGPQQQAETNRMTVGFEDQLKAKYPNIAFKERAYTDNWDAAIAQTNMADLIQKYKDLTMVYCASDDLANGAIAAIKAAKKTDQIKVYGSMGYPDALKRIKDGTQFGTYFSDGYIEYSTALYEALYFIQAGISMKTMNYPGTPILDQPTTPVTKENVDLVIETSHWKEADPAAWK